MCISSDSPVLAYARIALSRVEYGVAAVRERSGSVEELEQGLAALAKCLASLEAANEAQVPAAWSRFFMCYDAALLALRARELQSPKGAEQ